MQDDISLALQRIAPQHLLSRLAGKLASVETPWIKNFLIEKFAERYKVNLDEALKDKKDFKNFNEFFTRELKPGARAINDNEKSLMCPADGVISQLGDIKHDKVFQAKGHEFSLQQLLASKENANIFLEGKFSTIYLSPKDYHRVHMPLKGKLISMTHIPGKLYSVNKTTANNLSGLFAKNERVVCYFETEIGTLAMILVGAMIVGSIDTVWEGQVAPANEKPTNFLYKKTRSVTLKKGEEMGRFKLGSTVILLAPNNSVSWKNGLKENSPLKMGESLGDIR